MNPINAIAAILSQIPDVNIATALIIYGPMGATLAWFMIRGESKLEALEHAHREETHRVISELRVLSHRINGITKAMLVEAMTRENVNDRAREYAQRELAKMEEREAQSEIDAIKNGAAT